MWSRCRAVAMLGIAIAGTAAACSGGDSSGRGSQRAPVPPSTGAAGTTTTVPDITEVPRPRNVDDEAIVWFTHPTPGGDHVLLGVLRSSAPLPHPAVLLVHASAGLTVDSVTFAEELAALGFDVAIGCWFAPDVPPELAPQVVPCGDAPPFRGVTDRAVPDLESLVEAAHHALGPGRDLAILGTSRGAAVAALRATGGASEPLVLLSGPYEGWNTIDDPPRDEVNVVARATGITAPVLLLHGTDDAAVPLVQAEHLLAALRAAGREVEPHFYEGAGHNLLGLPAKADIVVRLRDFLCGRFVCAPPSGRNAAPVGRVR